MTCKEFLKVPQCLGCNDMILKIVIQFWHGFYPFFLMG